MTTGYPSIPGRLLAFSLIVPVPLVSWADSAGGRDACRPGIRYLQCRKTAMTQTESTPIPESDTHLTSGRAN